MNQGFYKERMQFCLADANCEFKKTRTEWSENNKHLTMWRDKNI